MAADGELNYDITGDSRGFEGALGSANSMIRGMGVSIKALLGPAAALVGVAGGLAAIGKAVGGAANLEQLGIAFEVMTGSAEKGKNMLDQIRAMGAATPYEFPALAKGAQTLLQFGVNTEKILPTLSMLGDIAGGDEQKLSSLALVFGQVSSAGRLTGGDLLQLVNVGFNPLLEISNRTGESMASLRDRMEKGEITIDDVAASFKAATSAGGMFYGMMERQSKTSIGLLSTLKDGINEIFVTIGKPINDAVKPILSGAISGVATLKSQLEGFGQNIAIGLQRAFSANQLGVMTEWLKAEFMVIGAKFLNLLGTGMNKAFTGLATFINQAIPAIGEVFKGVLINAGAAFSGFLVEKMGAGLAAVMENIPGLEDEAATMRAKSARARTELTLGGEKEGGGFLEQGQSMLKKVFDAAVRGAAGGKIVEDDTMAELEEDKREWRTVLDRQTRAGEKEAAEIEACAAAGATYGKSLENAAKKTDAAGNQAAANANETPPAPALLKVPALTEQPGGGGEESDPGRKIRLFGLEESKARREGRMSKADQEKAGFGGSLLDMAAGKPSGLLPRAAADAAAGAPAVSPPRGRGRAAESPRASAESGLLSVLKEIAANTKPLQQLATA